ncbi:hypothetical protein OUZ56_020356 [Daphnia magna]|uniref:GMP synthase n=1 Tax=Daphnia magna TaxID=35525 RepID=A0ABQ9ZF08_9CRUS|nr:hypothetical protein OUZ56_020356 [Daphnia magna]
MSEVVGSWAGITNETQQGMHPIFSLSCVTSRERILEEKIGGDHSSAWSLLNWEQQGKTVRIPILRQNRLCQCLSGGQPIDFAFLVDSVNPVFNATPSIVNSIGYSTNAIAKTMRANPSCE